MKKLVLSFGLILSLVIARGQGTQLLDQNGIKVSYTATKKEEDKKHDKWEISISIDNSSSADVVFLASQGPRENFLKVEVPNKKGLFALGMKEYTAEYTGQMSIDGQGVWRVKKGVTTDAFNTNVEKGATPEVKANFLKQLKMMSEIQLLKVPVAELSQQRSWLISANGSAAQEQSALRFIGWDNAQYAVLFDGMQFKVARDADLNNAVVAPSFNFLGWDHGRVTARFENGWLVISREGQTMGQNVAALNFLGSDGYNYSAALKPINNNRLDTGELLMIGQYRRSHDGAHTLLLQADGNVALVNAANQPTWQTGTSGKPAANITMQADGNLVIYNAQGVATWSSGTNGKGGVYLMIQDDGNLVMYNGNGDGVWSTNTRGR